MPSSYAHYRFGAQALELMDGNLRRRVQHFRQMYDVGIHGPDLFFYYNPILPTSTGALGSSFHKQTGQAFFTRAAAALRQHPSEGGMAYLFGVLAHYCLDAACHPLVTQTAAEGKIGHTELETEFDRYLLDLDGKRPTVCYDGSDRMRLTRGECLTVSAFYPPASSYTISRCVKNMHRITHFLSSRDRKRVRRLIGLGGKRALEMVMTNMPNANCSHLDEPLLRLYETALQHFGVCAPALLEHLSTGEPLGSEFEAIFG